ncbi:uncharacterized protein N7515_003856 [Penicillium bovifimosum]|uniref:Uncharacterized protein n=1 Tax=Penicillium bovifimosum TaxID=126998 RepID=A0A9W9H5N2_9EURO|nr:uncharacterized protein N7515_003856 [Penicillium bovifimosum]KAJ5139008.1 hypothetical protein N7515_003856 [Penicillium bovifimosum]
MPPIDYSKWDNIDTDSDSEPETTSVPRPQPSRPAASLPSRPAAPQPSTPAAPQPSTSTAPQASTPAAPANQTPSKKDLIKAVMVRYKGDPGPVWSQITIPSDHPVFRNRVPPVPALLEFPIIIHRVGTFDTGAFGCLDNQPITYLNIEPHNGFAPPEWQRGVGSCIVANKNKKDFTREQFEAIFMYCDRILDYFGESIPPPPHFFTRKEFERWYEQYDHNCRLNDRNDWTPGPSLYDV